MEGSGKTTLVHQLIDKKMLLSSRSATIEQYRIVLNDTPMLLVDVPGTDNKYVFTLPLLQALTYF